MRDGCATCSNPVLGKVWRAKIWPTPGAGDFDMLNKGRLVSVNRADHCRQAVHFQIVRAGVLFPLVYEVTSCRKVSAARINDIEAAGRRRVIIENAAHLSRYTHRVAISHRRLIAADDAGVAFRWKDYRADGPARWKTMRLHPHEFIRQFLLHVLPRGFHRIRPYGLLASANRAESIATARALLGADPPAVEARKQPDINIKSP